MARPRMTAFKERQSKASVISEIAEATGMTKKDVRAVLLSYANQAQRHLKRGACGEFMLHDFGIKMKRITRPATKARKGINPFTREEMIFKAKPASTSVRAVAMKAAKQMAK